MKRFLRRAACAAAMLLLTVCPVKALAAGVTLPPNAGVETSSDGEHKEEHSGISTFGIKEVERWRYLEVTVLDEELLTGISGVTVKLYRSGSGIPITGSPGGGYITDANGRIEIQVAKDDHLSYHIEIDRSGFYHKESAPFSIDDKEVYQTVKLKPIRFTVSYRADYPGTIPAGEPTTESVRWGETPENPPKVVTGDSYAFSYWSLNGKQVDLNKLQVYDNIELQANYVRQYLVKYEAGDYGYLDGPAEERVTAGEKPRHVPTPVPMSAREYRFVKWKIDALFSSKSVDPASITITGDITFKAVFDVRKHQPVIINTPTEPGTPTGSGMLTETGTPQPGPGSPTAAPIQPGPAAGPGGAGASHIEVHDREAAAENPSVDAADQTQPSGQVPPPLASGREGEMPVGPGKNPSVSVSGQADNTCSSRIAWLILVCSLVTLSGGLLRLRAIRRTVTSLTGREEGKEPAAEGIKAVATEVIAGLVCVILWGFFFVRSACRWDFAALAFWGVVQVTMAVLLVRGEYRLRRKH